MKHLDCGFSVLESRYVIEGDLLPEAALHVGSGLPGNDTDAAWIRDTRGPFIPGSSLRGVLRSTLERILQSLGGDRGCVSFLKESHPTCFSARSPEERKRIARLGDDELMEQLAGTGLCGVCRLFGCTVLASKLRISDSRPRTEPLLQKRDGVGIDRDTETAREKIKFDFEALEAGTDFDFRLEIENPTKTDFALLGILLTEMQVSGVDVGGKKSRGLGRVKLRCNYRVSYFDNAGGYKLADFLASGRLADLPREEFNATVNQHVGEYLKEENDVQPDAQ